MIELIRLYSALTRLEERIKRNQRELEQYVQEEADARQAYKPFESSSEPSVGHRFKQLMMSVIGREERYVEDRQRDRAESKAYLQACIEKHTQAQSEQAALVDEYDEMLSQLHRLKLDLSKTSDTYKEKVVEAFGERQTWRKACEEIDEALKAGKRVLSLLNEALNALDSAKSWSTVDMLGGGLFTDLAKYNHIDHAEEIMKDIEMALLRYRKELKDVPSDWNSQYEYISESHRLMDVLFDNIFTDVSNYQKIADNLTSLENLQGQVIDTQNKLMQLRRDTEKEIERSLDLYDVNKYQS
ncbi:hypothetical protein [Marinilactibacillus kalidii]|uniref:hypothetical protein n=1 Tax=Marinilactibacillus kalidii TaxID=2820274 RepID=UPI001ABDC6F7|nr:hypothetical protein [Marinilactibacillus kalidii]